MTETIAIVTDAWEPQINGVVTTLKQLANSLRQRGYNVVVFNPEMYRRIPMPLYPEIELVYNPWRVRRDLKKLNPDYIHIATEGPLGLFARNYCERHKLPYTTSYHTNFPEFIEEFTRIPAKWIYPFMRWLHKHAKAVLVTTQSMKQRLSEKGFKNLVVWNRAVDTTLFDPSKHDDDLFDHLERPIMINVGRVSPEKNLEAFLSIDMPGTKVIVGDGPIFHELKSKYPKVVFVGAKRGEVLAKHFASADVFVFPSLTDTFGVVMIEANASGLPVAAYPVTGPIDVIENNINGVLSDDLEFAIQQALNIPPTLPRAHVEQHHTIEAFTDIFTDTLAKISK